MLGGLGCTLLIRTDCSISENSESHSINSEGFCYKMHLHILNQDAIIKDNHFRGMYNKEKVTNNLLLHATLGKESD